MKKAIVCLLLLCLSISVMGCNGNLVNVDGTNTSLDTNQTDELSSGDLVDTKKVVFANETIMALLKAPEDNSKVQLGLSKYVEDADALYACYVNCYVKDEDRITVQQETGESNEEYATRNRTHEIEHIVRVMREKGFTVLEDYPYCYYNNEQLYEEEHAYMGTSEHLLMGECVIVGTYEQFVNVFNGKEIIDNYRMTVALAPRPDYVELMKQCGYTGEETQGVGVWCDYYHQEILDVLGSEYCMMEVQMAVPQD
ncbi:MAG: hypothetical protein IJ419_05740 [Agathobacter sp.]|nr:hypothetical protein [Agathobacter sp.]